MAQAAKKQKEPSSASFKVMTVVGIILLIILIPCLVCNVTLIVKSMLNDKEVPDFMGYKPFIVLSGSMEPTIELDDLVITKDLDADNSADNAKIAALKGLDQYRIKRVVKVDAEGNTVKNHGYPVYETEVVDGKTVPKKALNADGKAVYDLDANNNPQPEYVFGDDGQIVFDKIGKNYVPRYEYGDSDIIAYHTATKSEVETKGVGTVVTHRIIKAAVDEESKIPYFIVRGDNNNVSDTIRVTYDMVEGVYEGTRIPFLGRIAMFLQKPLGLVLFIGAPLLLFVLWDVIRRNIYEKQERARVAEIEAEEEAIRLQQEAEMKAQMAEKERAMMAELEQLRAAAKAAEENKDDSAE